MPPDPATAPARRDLPWLRRRSRAQASPPAAPTALSDFLSGRATHAGRHPDPAPAPPPVPAPAGAASSSLDLDEPASAPVPTARAAPVPARPSAGPRRRARVDVRVSAGERVLLTPTEPTLTLGRLQSGIGALTIEAACSAQVGDLRLGCVYELLSGACSTVQLTQGNRTAPPRSRRPVILAAHERFERLSLDLRQCTDLRRLIVYAFSESRTPLAWGGTLITTTFGGGRAELPLDTLQSGDVGVLLSLYNVHGEFVLRAEMQTLFGEAREAARAYGFDRITWLDDRTPVD